MASLGGRRHLVGMLLAVGTWLSGCGGGGGSPPALVPVPPSITAQPSSQSVMAGASATFTVAATGDAPLNYQWLRGGVDVPGANGNTFTLASTVLADNGSVWSARVGNAAGQVVSSGATLTVQARGTLSFVAGSLDPTSSGQGTADGNGAAARFSTPAVLAVDAAGNIYVVDTASHTIRKISPAGNVTTLAGVAGQTGPFPGPIVVDGVGSAARFAVPIGITAGRDGLFYVIDGLDSWVLAWSSIRTVSPQGEVKTVASSAYTQSAGIGLDGTGTIYINDWQGRLSRVGGPMGYTNLGPEQGYVIALTATQDGTLYYTFGNSIRKRTPAGVTTTIAGDATQQGSADGPGAQARFAFSDTTRLLFGGKGGGLVLDSAGNLFVTDPANHTVRKVTPSGAVTTVAGVAGAGAIQLGSLPGGLFTPSGLALLDDKTLFVSSGNAVLKISLP